MLKSGITDMIPEKNVLLVIDNVFTGYRPFNEFWYMFWVIEWKLRTVRIFWQLTYV